MSSHVMFIMSIKWWPSMAETLIGQIQREMIHFSTFLQTFWYACTFFNCAINSSQVEKMISSLHAGVWTEAATSIYHKMWKSIKIDWDLQLRLYQKIKTQNHQLKFHCNFWFKVIEHITYIVNPGSLWKRACGVISSKWHYVASFKLRNTFKVICPVRNTASTCTSTSSFIRNRWTLIWQC